MPAVLALPHGQLSTEPGANPSLSAPTPGPSAGFPAPSQSPRHHQKHYGDHGRLYFLRVRGLSRTTSSFGQSPRASQPGLANGKPLGKNLLVYETDLDTFVEVIACYRGPGSGEEVSLRFTPFLHP